MHQLHLQRGKSVGRQGSSGSLRLQTRGSAESVGGEERVEEKRKVKGEGGRTVLISPWERAKKKRKHTLRSGMGAPKIGQKKRGKKGNDSRRGGRRRGEGSKVRDIGIPNYFN